MRNPIIDHQETITQRIINVDKFRSEEQLTQGYAAGIARQGIDCDVSQRFKAGWHLGNQFAIEFDGDPSKAKAIDWPEKAKAQIREAVDKCGVSRADAELLAKFGIVHGLIDVRPDGSLATFTVDAR